MPGTVGTLLQRRSRVAAAIEILNNKNNRAKRKRKARVNLNEFIQMKQQGRTIFLQMYTK